MKLLHVDASPKSERSNSRALARHFVACLHEQNVELDIDYLDLTQNPPAHIDDVVHHRRVHSYCAAHCCNGAGIGSIHCVMSTSPGR